MPKGQPEEQEGQDQEGHEATALRDGVGGLRSAVEAAKRRLDIGILLDCKDEVVIHWVVPTVKHDVCHEGVTANLDNNVDAHERLGRS